MKRALLLLLLLPALPAYAEDVLLPSPRPAGLGQELDWGDAPVVDTDENVALPPYPAGARVSTGKNETYAMGESDTLLDVARHFRLGYVELRAANPGIDPWMPVPGEEVTLPFFKLLPRAEQKGVVVNLAQMRLYYFTGDGVRTFPIGIGREGLLTPQGKTTIVRKTEGPSWFPTARMREENPFLPAAVPPGPNNPMGTHALYLGWPEFRIHGTDKPWAVGRRVSSGCMRLYPEDIKEFYGLVPVGAQVTVVDQPVLVGRIGDELYLEVQPSKSQSDQIEVSGEHGEKGLTDGLRKVISDAAGEEAAAKINWEIAERVVALRTGIPTVIANLKEDGEALEMPEALKEKKKPAAHESVRPSAPPTYNN